VVPTLNIIYEDNHLLGIHKPAGLLVQGDHTGDVTALALARAYLKEAYDKPGNVYLGLVHRIDRPVSGVVVFARTSKAASRLSKSFHDRQVTKTYLAIVSGVPSESEGQLIDHLERLEGRARLVIAGTNNAREVRLRYRVVGEIRNRSLLEVSPETGRYHQIRVQLSGAGFPIIGDLKYGASEPLPDKSIALHAVSLTFPHPVGGEPVRIDAPPPDSTLWKQFAPMLR